MPVIGVLCVRIYSVFKFWVMDRVGLGQFQLVKLKYWPGPAWPRHINFVIHG